MNYCNYYLTIKACELLSNEIKLVALIALGTPEETWPLWALNLSTLKILNSTS